MDSKLPKIHFIMPSGGAKGSFQAGFIYQLFTTYSHLFTTHQVDGISIGAINGLSIFSKDMEKLKNIWFSIKSKEDIFCSLSNSYFFNDFFSYLYSFTNMSIFDNKKLIQLIKNYDINYSSIHKYNCGLVNLDKGKIEYINGTNENLIQYVIGSSSPWILSPPCNINNTMYTDGGLLELYPSKYIQHSTADIIVIVGYDEHYNKLEGTIGNNIFTYLERIIEISMYNNIKTNINNIKQLIDTHNIVVIPNKMNIDILNFSQEDIIQNFNFGTQAVQPFIEKYLI